MLQIVEKQYGAENVLSFREIPREERRKLVQAMGPQIRCVAGHLRYNEHQYIPRPSRPFTMLREPTERVISLYYFILREKTQPSHELLKSGKLTLETIAKRQGSLMARFIAGYEQKDPISDEQLLDEAKAILERTMVTFGLTERFDESILLFNKALGWNVRGYAKANVTKNRPSRQQLAPADVDTIRAHNAVDTEIYRFAKELFEKRIADQPQPDFENDLANLRRNVVVAQSLSRVNEGWRKIREIVGLAK